MKVTELHKFFEANSNVLSKEQYMDILSRFCNCGAEMDDNYWWEKEDAIGYSMEEVQFMYHDESEFTKRSLTFSTCSYVRNRKWEKSSEADNLFVKELPCKGVHRDLFHLEDWKDSSVDYQFCREEKWMILEPYGFDNIWCFEGYYRCTR